jgi:hypothetical protein
MYKYHYLQPENMWGVFFDGSFVAIFSTAAEAAEFCARNNAKGG